MVEFARYDVDWIDGFVQDPEGRFIRFEQGVEALSWAAEMLAAAGKRPESIELRAAAEQLRRVDVSITYDEYYGWSVSVDTDPAGRFVAALDVARPLRAAAELLDRAGHWASANQLRRAARRPGETEDA